MPGQPRFLGEAQRRADRISLRYRLPLSYAAVALLTALVLGGILLLVLTRYYSQAEQAYLDASADRAIIGLSTMDWPTLSASGTAAEMLLAKERTQALALGSQLRIEVKRLDGSVLVDSGLPTSIDPSKWTQMGPLRGLIGRQGTQGQNGGAGGSEQAPPLLVPSPVGQGLFSGGDASAGVRSSRSTERPLTVAGRTVGSAWFSDGPAYGATVIRTTLTGWLLAATAAVLLAASLGWFASRRLTRPLLAITTASDRMAAGDLTARTEVHRADELGRLAESFNVMAGRVQQHVTALQRFVADAAHEIGTPLTALEADLDLVDDRSENDEQRRLVRRAMRQAQRLEGLSANLLQLSRLDTGAVPAPAEPIDLGAVVHHVADTVASRAEQARIELVLDLIERPVWVRGYPERLTSVLGNLTDNALKFTPAGGTITIGLAVDGGMARVWVSDTGIGIPAGDMEGLFGRFHRGRNASAYPGNGLGLAIVKATMDLHGGSVHAESSPGGSQFDVVLPLAVATP